MRTTMLSLMFAALALTFGPATAQARSPEKAQIAPTRALAESARLAKVALFKKMVKEMGKVPKSCRYKGKKLWGKVKVVTSFPDIKVKVVSSFPDLKVKWVSSFPDKCGKWKKVSSFPDFKIKYVSSFPDIKIKVVSSFPGVP